MLNRFRWVYCQLESFRQCVKPSALRKTLFSLPKTLDETYERILRYLESNDHLEDTIQALRWLCFALRPLDLLEMVEILAIQTGEGAGFFPDDRMPDPADIMAVCSSLISCTVEESTSPNTAEAVEISRNGSISDQISMGWRSQTNFAKRVRLAHFSVMEYLLSERCTLHSEFQTPLCHDMIADGCLRYLLHVCDQAPLTNRWVQQYPLARYSARCWWQHAQRAGPTSKSTVRLLAFQLLNNQNSTLTWVQLCNIDDHFDTDLALQLSDLAQPLYYAASVGLPDVVSDILQRTIDIDVGHVSRGSVSPLWGAANRGHEQVVRMLLQAGADANAEDKDAGTALQIACMFGHENVVRVLLDAGAGLYGQNQEGYIRNALGASVSMQSNMIAADVRARIVQMLLDAGIDRSARSAAVFDSLRFPDILNTLLTTDVDIDCRGSYTSTPLQCAVFYGLEHTVRLLLDHGADPNARPGQWGRALRSACREGHSAVAEILLNSGAILSEDNEYLYCASECGRTGTVQLLLRSGVSVNQQGEPYGYALQAAAANNHEAAMQQLLDAGADINLRGGRFGNALQAGCSDSWPGLEVCGKPSTLFHRRREKPDHDPDDINYDDSLSIALRAHEITLELSLSFAPEDNIHTEGCDLDLRATPQVAHGIVEDAITIAIGDIAGTTRQEDVLDAVSIDSLADDLSQVVKRVVATTDDAINDAGADQEEKPLTPYDKFPRIIGMVREGSGSYYNPDPEKGYEWTIQAFLDAGGVTIQVSGGKYYSGFDDDFVGCASPDIVRTLLASGADVNAQGGIFGNALQAASRFNHQDIAEYLLANGADINAQGGEYGTALQAACASFAPGEELVQLLIDAGANVHIPGGVYGCALQAACYRGSVARVRLLLNAGADVNIQGGVYGTPLQAACASPVPQMELVRTLLDAGARDDLVQGGIGKFGSALNAIRWKLKGYRPVIKRPAPLKEAGFES